MNGEAVDFGELTRLANRATRKDPQKLNRAG